MKFILIGLTCLALIGCVSTAVKGSVFSVAPKPIETPDEGTIYIYRSDTISGYASTRVAYVDNKRIVDIKNGGFTWVKVKEGKHVIKSEIPWSMRAIGKEYVPNTITITTEKGKTYYVHLDIGVYPKGTNTEMAFVGGNPVPVYSPKVKYTKRLVLENEIDALKRLKTYKYQPAE